MALRDVLRLWRKATSTAPQARWVVLDVESSGLDPSRDRLLAIAAIAVQIQPRRAVIDLADSFEVVLLQPQTDAAVDRENILLHGIGVGAQRAGIERRPALQGFATFVGDAPLIAFHAAFDRAMIEGAFAIEALAAPANPWLDLEPLAAVLRPKIKARSLDEWMLALGIRCLARHQAAADTLATAELLLKLWPALRAEIDPADFKAVTQLASLRRWLPP